MSGVFRTFVRLADNAERADHVVGQQVGVTERDLIIKIIHTIRVDR